MPGSNGIADEAFAPLPRMSLALSIRRHLGIFDIEVHVAERAPHEPPGKLAGRQDGRTLNAAIAFRGTRRRV
jgi:hypothetical protein